MDVALRLKDPIVPQLFSLLRKGIVEMRLRPGEVLSEQDIAGRFGVSRQPVREAFIKLSDAGLVEIRPSRGTFVLKISMREVANARFVREAIECAMARNACRLASPAQIVALRRQVEDQSAAAALNDYWTFNEMDELFHRTIAEIVECDYAWRTVEAARIQTDRVRYLSLPNTSPMPLLISQHEEIVRHIASRHPDRAEAAMVRHLREILVALPRLAAAHPDLFADSELPPHTIGLAPGD